MSRGGIWRTLGIDRTDDVGAIRRAYAQALRAMDPDADPDGFARLRDARDQALAIVRDGAADAPQRASEAAAASGREPEAGGGLDASVLRPPVLAQDTPGALTLPASGAVPLRPLADARADGGEGESLVLPVQSWAPPVIDAAAGDVSVLPARTAQPYDAGYAELLQLLGGEDDPSDGRPEALVRFLFADPRLARLAFAEDAERWFAAVLTDTIPRSDPVLAPVADHFGWSRQAGSIALSDAAERVAERARSLAYAAAAERPGHADHRLWTELRRPAHEKSPRGWFIRGKRMRDYLATIRRSYPDAEEFLDPVRVARRDRVRVSQPNRWAWGFGFFVLLRALIAFVPGDHGGPDLAPRTIVAGPTTVADREGDLNLALLSFADGLTLDRVRRENPALGEALARRWQEASAERTTLETFMAETRRTLIDHLDGAVAHARYEDVAALRRLDLAELDRARARGADVCAQLLRGELPIDQVRNRDADSQRRQILAAILLADPPSRAGKRRGMFTIPGSVMVRLERETGLSRAALVVALDRRGSDRGQCDARRALLTAALDLPRATGLPLLRGL